MKTRLKIAMVAVPVLAATLFSTAGWSQTYKPDWATRTVLAGGGTDPANSMTIIAPSNALSGITLTLPATTGSSGYVLQTNGAGVLSWTAQDTLVTMTGDVIGTSGANSVVALRGVSLNSDMATPSNANMMIYNSTGTSWHAVAMSADATISNAGAITLATTGAAGATAGAHMISAINSNSSTGTINLVNGGTGASDAAGARSNLSAAASGANSDITSLTGLTGAISNPTALTFNGTADRTLNVAAAADGNAGSALTIAGGAGTSAGSSYDGGAVTINGGAPAAGGGSAGAVDINTTAGNVNIGNSGGTTTITGTVSLPANSVTNGELANSSMTFTSTGSTLTASGSVALGGSPNYDINLAHANTWTGTQAFGGTALTPDAPTALSANQDDWDIGSSNSAYRISASAAVNLTGIANGAAGRLVVLVNVGSTYAIVLKNETTSTDANKFHFPGVAEVGDVILAPDGTVTLMYDGTISRWRMISAQ